MDYGCFLTATIPKSYLDYEVPKMCIKNHYYISIPTDRPLISQARIVLSFVGVLMLMPQQLFPKLKPSAVGGSRIRIWAFPKIGDPNIVP